jgi:hypothetical protein
MKPHRRHHSANTELSHMLTRSGLTYLEVFLMILPDFFRLFVCSFLVLYEALQ